MTNFLGKGIEEIAIRDRIVARGSLFFPKLSLSLSLLIGRQLAGQSNQLRNRNCLFPLRKRVNIYEFLVERSGTSFPSYETVPTIFLFHTLLSIIPSRAPTLYVYSSSKDFSRRYFNHLLDQERRRRRRERKGEEKRREHDGKKAVARPATGSQFPIARSRKDPSNPSRPITVSL